MSALRLSFRHPLVRWPLMTLLVMLVAILIAWLATPPLVRHITVSQVEQQLGRKASVGEVSFNPFSLTLIARDFTLYENDGSTPALQFDSLLVDLQASSLFRAAPVVRELRLEKPSLHLVRLRGANAGRNNFSDILERLAAKPESDSPAPRFSIANIQLTQGSVRFDDKVSGKQVKIDALETGVPFLSNFDTAIDTFVEPKLSATVNGTRFALKGRSKPFASSRETTLALDIDQLDIAELAALSPVPLPVKLHSARLSTELDLNFLLREQTPEVLLSGKLELAGIELRDPRDAPLLKAASLTTQISKLNVLSGETALATLKIQAPEIWAALDEKGTLNWAALAAPKTARTRASRPAQATQPGQQSPAAAGSTVPPMQAATSPATATSAKSATSATSATSANSATSATTAATPVTATAKATPAATTTSTVTATGGPSTASSPAPASAEKPAIRFSLAQFNVVAGVVNWRDAANASPALSQKLTHIDIEGGNLALQAGAPPANLRVRAGAQGGQQIAFTGQVDASTARVAGRAEIKGVSLATYQPYLERSLAGALSGRLQASTLLVFENSRLRLNRMAAAIDDFKLSATGKSDGAFSAKKIALDNALLDTATHRFNAGAFTVTGLTGDVSRTADGRLNLERFLKPANIADTGKPAVTTAATVATPGKAASKAPASAPAWQAGLDRFVLVDGTLNLSDETVQPAVQLKLAGLGLKAENISSAMDRAVKLSVSGTAHGGKLAIDGSITAKMASLELDIDARDLPFTLLQPYYAKGLNIKFAGGTASTKGHLSMVLPTRDKALALSYRGSARIADFRSLNKTTNADFLKWKTLDLSGLHAELGQGRPEITLDNVALADFYMRAILSAEGRLNLREILVADTPVATTPATAAATPAPKEKSGKTSVATLPAPAEQDRDTGPIVKVGKIDIKSGNINFTDNFVQPNYTVNMTGMNGAIGTIASNQAQPASIELVGKIDNAAPVTISGSLNPLFKPMFLDIKASANGIELPRLSPYATKYAGYPIEKGKLSMDVTYRIDQQKLTAQNSVRIDQLTFGERVDSPTATNLPVLLAVKLLKDRNGQIEINLPVSGSLDDPQFSIGGLIGRVLLNLLTRALTSPFALISSAFGGGHGEDLGYAEFEPGTSTLTPAVQAKLDTLAKAMQDRPALKLDIIGRADRATDTEGSRLQQLNRSMRMMKLKDSLDRGQNTQPEDVVLSEAERMDYLEKIYKAAKFEKPKNAVGLNKSLPPDEMQALILSNTEVSDDNLRSLASRRATVVRRYLENTGKISLERMFLIAPRLGTTGDRSKGKEPPNRVEFALN